MKMLSKDLLICLIDVCKRDTVAQILLFNSQCLDILDQAAVVKLAHAPHKHCLWVDDCIKAFQRNCRKVECQWKATKLEVHRLHLKD